METNRCKRCDSNVDDRAAADKQQQTRAASKQHSIAIKWP